MKNITLFLIIMVSLQVFSCEKEDTAQVTIVEGRVINHITKEPIPNITFYLTERIAPENPSWQDWSWYSESDITDENGKFKFNYTAYDDQYGGLTLSTKEPLSDDYESMIINGNEVEHGEIIDHGIWLPEGETYYYSIEVTPK